MNPGKKKKMQSKYAPFIKLLSLLILEKKKKTLTFSFPAGGMVQQPENETHILSITSCQIVCK